MIGEFASNCTVSNYDEKQYLRYCIATLSKREKNNEIHLPDISMNIICIQNFEIV